MFEGLQAIRKELKEAKLENPDREEIHDGYQLRFVGKDYAKFITGLPTETVLVPDTEWNNQEHNKNSENIFITGDNLDALKHLLCAYSGRIKMIYIDPLYNTGSDGFVYNDKFGFSEDQLREKLGLTDMEVARIKALEGKCSHSAWLTFMLPRLAIAKRLLTNDGVIFISIDDNEHANLKLLCDEIFTENNSVADFIWIKTDMLWKKKSTTTNVEGVSVSSLTEHILCYKKAEKGINNRITPKEERSYPYKDKDGNYRKTVIEKKNEGSYTRKTMLFSIMGHFPREGKRWQIGEDTARELEQKQRFIYENGMVKLKIYDFEDKNTSSAYPNLLFEHGSTESATQEVKDLLNGNYFDNPKPTKLIKQLCIFTDTLNKDSIILDFFAGSATTAHAVMALNNKDKGNRKYIMVQLDEATKENGEARKARYKTIDQIARARIKKAAEQLGDTSGFRHYKLTKVEDNNVLDKIDAFDPDNETLLNDDMLEPFSGKSLHTDLKATGIQTLLTTWLIDDGYPLTTPVNEIKFGNYTAYMPQNSYRLYLIDKCWDSRATKDLLNKVGKNELTVQSIVLYNHSFNFTALTELKNNLKSILGNKIKLIERF